MSQKETLLEMVYKAYADGRKDGVTALVEVLAEMNKKVITLEELKFICKFALGVEIK